MKIYAITNRLDERTLALLMKEGVKSKSDIYSINKFRELYEILDVNDKVIMVTIGDLINCSNLCWIFNALNSKHTYFYSISERNKFSYKSPLKRTYHDYILKVVNYEQRVINDLQNIYPLIDRTEMNRRIQALSLAVLVETFRNDSILSR